ncbi:MAG TPA: hypothetical protein VHX49_10845 [Candidatus Acidoferrales bacterium]|nr:hypothetical protein [Candidatus Acidoferrales bacterium]
MSAIAKWGHWVVAAFFAFKGIGLIYENVPHFAHALRNHIPLTDQDYLLAVPWVLYPACAWGILKWRQWGQIGAIALSVLELAVAVTLVVMYGPLSLDRNIILWSALNAGVVIWFVLPEVRAGYWPRQRPA